LRSSSSRATSEHTDVSELREFRATANCENSWREEASVGSTKPEHNLTTISRPLSVPEHAQLAVLQFLNDSIGALPFPHHELSPRQWKQFVRWLDYSGLALYFFDRYEQQQWRDSLPDWVTERLQLGLTDNAARTRSQVRESAAIQQQFQELGVRYAVIKGISLWPHSVPDPELRSQLDLDFLVAEASASSARSILERRGYRLYALSENCWEFKRNEQLGITVKDLYKDLRSWAVELHIEPEAAGNYVGLNRLEWRELYGMRMPTLSSVDTFLWQGLHVHKNVCAEFLRTAHIWEFQNHVRCRRHDTHFWNAVHNATLNDQNISMRLGIVLLLITEVLGEFAPNSLTEWTVSLVPAEARTWIKRYGHRSVLGKFPGNKRYLLLQRALVDTGISARRPLWETLLPTRLPPQIIRPLPNESASTRITRNWMQVKFIAHRLRFHLIAGFDYWWESRPWRRATRKFMR